MTPRVWQAGAESRRQFLQRREGCLKGKVKNVFDKSNEGGIISILSIREGES